jgi:hypothetical protein
MAIVLDGTNGVTTNSGTLISATTIGVGGATPSTSGAGITFPATQSASTDANTLDDYEEGTWTVTATLSTSGSMTFSTNTGYYTKVGNRFLCTGFLVVGSVSSPVGQIRVSLPATIGTVRSTACIAVYDTASGNNYEFGPAGFAEVGVSYFAIDVYTGTLNGGGAGQRMKAGTQITFSIQFIV